MTGLVALAAHAGKFTYVKKVSVPRDRSRHLARYEAAAGKRARAGKLCTSSQRWPPMDEPLRPHAPMEPKHYRAICDEIGERLSHSLARDSSPIPPRLRKLLGLFAELQGGAPPINPERRDR
jgi:hypothetical protein